MKTSFLLFFTLVVAVGLGCSSESQDEAPSANAARDAECDSTLVFRKYPNLRGVIEQLPDATSDPIYLRHEAIDDFTSPCSEEPLKAGGILSFLLGEGGDTTGLRAQGKVAFGLEVNWDATELPGTIVGITPLPDTTTLVLSAQ